MNDSRLRGLHRLDVRARIEALAAAGFLKPADAASLRSGRHVLPVNGADAMIENVIGAFGLPLGIAPNFRVDGRDCLVPLVVEEPSVVAALSSAARIARQSGGFETERQEALLIGQVHLVDVPDRQAATAALLAATGQLRVAAAAVHPRLGERGGGLREVEVRQLLLDDGEPALAVHLLVDTRDAMGANLVNTLCEALAPAIEALSGGRAVLRILSNLADRALVSARARFALEDLAATEEAAARARDGIVLANRLAIADPYRAATHNKGIMNGIDPLAIATGNDWRAIEAGAHAFAARTGRYLPLTTWIATPDGSLEGRIELPLKPGIAGGTGANNPAVALCLGMTGVRSADELASLMAAAGLGQNFAALRALATTGIQAGHMRLHARSVAAVRRRDAAAPRRPGPGDATACGKVILFGEHAVVYGRHALAVPLEAAAWARAAASVTPELAIPDWGIREPLPGGGDLARMVATIAGLLGVDGSGFSIEVGARVPASMGLGSSAAVAVAVARALAAAGGVAVDDRRINEIAFACEQLAHGTPSGVDNTLATWGEPVLFRRDGQTRLSPLDLPADLPLVVACGAGAGRTLEQVAAVRERRARQTERFERLFDEIDAICLEGAKRLAAGDYEYAGALMNTCHGLLNAIGVSTPELEGLVAHARAAGAAGAKLTGAGGGGSIVALCPGREAEVVASLRAAGYRTIPLNLDDSR
ncbi:MAG TPA: hydroxymethylglutaryl-CoA reductase, degradative [Woeseiaceae bacterium]|nr:hydroxymethylglutaryl-CoA reductase, degradative [Woeseiaceae bacterium]